MDFAQELAFQSKGGAILLQNGARQDIAVLEHNLVGRIGRRKQHRNYGECT